MLDAKMLSAAIRKKKKNLLRPDWDAAGQNLDPTMVNDLEQNSRVSQTLEESGVEGYDHEPPSEAAMGEEDDSQDLAKRKRISARIAKYFESM